MKIKNLLILGCLILGINSLSLAQTNLMENWAGPDAMGAGAPNEYGWEVRTGEGGMDESNHVVWNPANAGSGVRYRDVDANTNPQSMMDGAVWSGRLLYLRWDAGSNTINYVFSYPVELQANTQYEFSMMYQWWDNGPEAPIYTVGISRDQTGQNPIATAEFATETRREMRQGEMTFQSEEAGVYYVTFKSNTASLSGVSNFSLVASTTTSSAKELASESYLIYPNPSKRENGLYIAANGNSNEMVELYIYGVTGKVQKHVTINASQGNKIDISDLASGMYVAKVVTSKGSVNKTLVIQ